MYRVRHLLCDRNVILCAALGLGLFWGEGAPWTEKVALPALALVMTLSTMGVSGSAFRSPRSLLGPALSGIAMNYVLLAGFILGLNFLLIRDEALRSGFIILAAVPPAVAVIPFTGFLNGSSTFSLIGSIGCWDGLWRS